MLIGHETQVAAFLEALHSGRMHHAWLLAGPKGVGKRVFAECAALRLLAEQGEGLAVPPGHPAEALMAARSHPDHRLLAPPADSKTGQILVDDVRALGEFMHSFPALGNWRTLIVDPIDGMNKSSANAFLKELEEPRGRTVYFLVSHAPGRLLPTIRSRCRMLRFAPLSDGDCTKALRAALPDADPETLAALVAVADGSPGTALSFRNAEVPALQTAIEGLMRGGDPAAFARGFQAAGAVAKFEALLVLAPRRLAEAARAAPSEALVDCYARATELAGKALALAYDRAQVAFALATLLADAGALSRR
jgi:DNA polymerase-3 subunit delta'